MHPAYSVIFFTVASGAGFGTLAILGLAPLLGLSIPGGAALSGLAFGFVLSSAGLLASMAHLRHPERAWRAFSQWRSSWLSREGVLAIAALATAAAYGAALLLHGELWLPAGLAAAILALATVYATGMIYAQLRTVARWHTGLTPCCYLAFSLAGGALSLAAIGVLAPGRGSGPLAAIAGCALALSAIAKFQWWRQGDSRKRISTTETATGLGRVGAASLFEAPHTGESYLTTEMGFRIARKHALKLRRLVMALGFAIPALLCVAALLLPGDGLWLPLALLSHLVGLIIERWLFFAESEHSVSLYY